MIRIRPVAVLAASATMCWLLGTAGVLRAQDAAAQGQAGGSKQPYTMPEYNAEQNCANDKNPASQVKCLDDFVAKYPNSNLLIYVYPMYLQDYFASKNYGKVIEYADKLLTLGDKVGANEKYQALYGRAQAFNALPAADQATQAKGAIAAADACIKLLPELKKPDNMDDNAFADQKKNATIYLNGTAAQAAMAAKDYPTAINYYKAVLAINSEEAITNYQLGKAYLSQNPPQTLQGFWYIARAISSKTATQQQVNQLKPYLRKLIGNYQQASCDSLMDAEFNELLQLASSATEMPATYKMPSSADLTAAQKDMTIASVMTDLKAGGDKSKTTWLASCGLEFPDVPGKLLEVTPGATPSDPVVLKLAFVTSDEQFQAATTPDMVVNIVGQPEAGKLEKDNPVRFTATLASYDPDPAFLVHWDKGKVNEEDLPKEKTKKPAPTRKPAPKKPSP